MVLSVVINIFAFLVKGFAQFVHVRESAERIQIKVQKHFGLTLVPQIEINNFSIVNHLQKDVIRTTLRIPMNPLGHPREKADKSNNFLRRQLPSGIPIIPRRHQQVGHAHPPRPGHHGRINGMLKPGVT